MGGKLRISGAMSSTCPVFLPYEVIKKTEHILDEVKATRICLRYLGPCKLENGEGGEVWRVGSWNEVPRMKKVSECRH